MKRREQRDDVAEISSSISSLAKRQCLLPLTEEETPPEVRKNALCQNCGCNEMSGFVLNADKSNYSCKTCGTCAASVMLPLFADTEHPRAQFGSIYRMDDASVSCKPTKDDDESPSLRTHDNKLFQLNGLCKFFSTLPVNLINEETAARVFELGKKALAVWLADQKIIEHDEKLLGEGIVKVSKKSHAPNPLVFFCVLCHHVVPTQGPWVAYLAGMRADEFGLEAMSSKIKSHDSATFSDINRHGRKQTFTLLSRISADDREHFEDAEKISKLLVAAGEMPLSDNVKYLFPLKRVECPKPGPRARAAIEANFRSDARRNWEYSVTQASRTTEASRKVEKRKRQEDSADSKGGPADESSDDSDHGVAGGEKSQTQRSNEPSDEEFDAEADLAFEPGMDPEEREVAGQVSMHIAQKHADNWLKQKSGEPTVDSDSDNDSNSDDVF
jgi:hypothetical protein